MVNNFSFVKIEIIIIVAFSIKPSIVIVIVMIIVIIIFELKFIFRPLLAYIFLTALLFLLTKSE